MSHHPNACELICVNDLMYRWSKSSTSRGVELNITLNEIPTGQVLIAQCPRVFRPDMVPDMIEAGYKHEWQPQKEGDPITLRWTKRGIIKVSP